MSLFWAFVLGACFTNVIALVAALVRYWRFTRTMREGQQRLAELTARRDEIQRQLNWIERKDLDA